MSATELNEAWQASIREALERAQANVDLHIEREVFHLGTANAVAEEFTMQLGKLLAPVPAKGGES